MAFFSLYIFSFSFPLSWPVALNGRFSYMSQGNSRLRISSFLCGAHCYAAGAFRRAKPSAPCRKDLDSGSLWIHWIPDTRSICASKNGGPLTRSNIHLTSYHSLEAWNENFFKGGSVAALDKGLTVSGILLILDDSLTFISKIFLSFDRAMLRDGNYIWSSCLIRIQDGKWWEEVD